jgi:energy-coupling factor transporter ATP-binding protein EcfA2
MPNCIHSWAFVLVEAAGIEPAALFRGFNFTFQNGQRIGVAGRNGLGKTTLLKLVLGELKPTEGTVKVGQLTRFNYVDQGRLQLREERTALEEVSDGTEFGVVFFDRDTVRFPEDGIPAEADVTTREAAAQFIESVPGGVGSCVLDGLLAALEFAKAANVGTKLILYVGDGDGSCREQEESWYLRRTLMQVMEANLGVASISTIGVLEPSPLDEQFLIDLAEQNGGTYTRVQR